MSTDAKGFRLKPICQGQRTTTAILQGFTAVTVGHYVLVFGGKAYTSSNAYHASFVVYVFSCQSCTWTRKLVTGSSLPGGLYGHCASLAEDCMYAFSGVNDHGSLKRDLWKLDIVLFEWQRAGPFFDVPSTGRSDATIEYFEESKELVVIGGCGTSPAFRPSLTVYRLRSSRWHVPIIKGQPPLERYQHASCVCGINRVAIVGGARYGEKLRNIFFLTRGSNQEAYTWSRPVLNLNLPSLIFGAACDHGKIYVCGGSRNKNDSPSLTIFDISKAKWRENIPLRGRYSMAGHRMVRTNRKMYLVGGRQPRSLESTTFELSED